MTLATKLNDGVVVWFSSVHKVTWQCCHTATQTNYQLDISIIRRRHTSTAIPLSETGIQDSREMACYLTILQQHVQAGQGNIGVNLLIVGFCDLLCKITFYSRFIWWFKSILFIISEVDERMPIPDLSRVKLRKDKILLCFLIFL